MFVSDFIPKCVQNISIELLKFKKTRRHKFDSKHVWRYFSLTHYVATKEAFNV